MSFADRRDFKIAIHAALKRAVTEGKVSTNDHSRVLALLRRPHRKLRTTGERIDVLERWRDGIAKSVPAAMLGVDGAIPWQTIIDYLVEHWDDILRLLIAILVLVI